MSNGEGDLLNEVNEEWRKVVVDLADLAVHLGLMASVLHTYPEHVQEGFLQRLQHARKWSQREMEAITQFGEAYDDGDPTT